MLSNKTANERSIADRQPPADMAPPPATPLDEAVHKIDSAGDTMGAAVLSMLWHMIAQYRSRMIASLALGVLSALFQLAPPAAASGMTAAFLAGTPEEALLWALAIPVSAVAIIAFYGCSTAVSHLIAADIQRDHRDTIRRKLKSAPLGAVSQHSSLDYHKLLIDDVERLEDGVAHLLPEMTAAYAAPLAFFGVMLALDWRLGLAAIAPTVASFVVMSIIMRKAVGPTNEFNQAQANVAETMGEVVQAIPIVKTFNNSEAALARANGAINRFHRALGAFIDLCVTPTTWFFLFATSNLIFLTPASLWLLQTGGADLPTVVFFHLAALSLSTLLSGMFGVSNRLRMQEGVIARYCALMALPDLPIVEKDDATPNGADVVFDAVSFSYGEGQVVDRLSLRVKAGSTVALVGPSGSGKTTLARLLARFWDVGAGRILIGGVDIRGLTPTTLSRHVSFVFQDISLFSRSIADNIRIGREDASDDAVIAAAKAAQAHDFITALPEGYQTILNGSHGLSLGQKQRISIARALLRDAPILVLDEATAYADPENEHEVQRAISALAADKTVIVIAHRLSTIRNADHIVFLDQGRIAEQGTHDALIAAAGAYAAQWRTHRTARSFQLSSQTEEAGA